MKLTPMDVIVTPVERISWFLLSPEGLLLLLGIFIAIIAAIVIICRVRRNTVLKTTQEIQNKTTSHSEPSDDTDHTPKE